MQKAVPGCPMVVSVLGGGGPGPQVALPPPGPVLQPAHLLITHPGGKLEDIEVNVEGNYNYMFYHEKGSFNVVSNFLEVEIVE